MLTTHSIHISIQRPNPEMRRAITGSMCDDGKGGAWETCSPHGHRGIGGGASSPKRPWGLYWLETLVSPTCRVEIPFSF